MTKWVENPTGGRDRGPAGIARAWAGVITRPRRFFRVGVAPGDQAPGLVFAAVVVLVEEATRLALVPDAVPVVGGRPTASLVLWLAIVVVLVTPAVLHLTAALQTLLLIPLAPDRAGVSETVQVIAYATAPCVFAGAPIPAVRALCAAYGSVLLAVGLADVHGVSLGRGAAVAAVPAAIVFGYGFRGFAAASAVLAQVAPGTF